MKEDKDLEKKLNEIIDYSTRELKASLPVYFPHIQTTEPLKCGDWETDINGHMQYTPDKYMMYHSDIVRPDFIIKLMDMNMGLNFNGFLPVYLQALKNRNVLTTSIQVFFD